jgi:hypothetical protein
MIRLRSLLAGRAIRGTPRPGFARSWRWLGYGLLTCLVLFQAGCASDPCGGCNGLGLFGPTGFFARTSYRIFNHPVPVAEPCCGATVVAPAPITVAAPAAATVVPGPPTAVVAPAAPPSAVPPAPSASELEPIPRSSIEASPKSGTRNQNPNAQPDRAGFNTRRSDPSTRVARRRSDDATGITIASPGPISRPAQAGQIDPEDALDHLPPLDLPGEVTGSTTPPRPPAARRPTESASDANKSTQTESSPSESELEVGAVSTPAPDPSPLSSATPPLARFVAVDLKLAGGSAPTAAGIKWLGDKGYRTVLDLRETSEVPPAFVADITDRGLRYIALPITLKTFDLAHITRFNYELAAADSRPLYFFDTDGSIAGALWYVRRVNVDHVDQEVARREAKELGLADRAYWQAAADFLAVMSAPSSRAAGDAAAKAAGSVPAKTARAASRNDNDTKARGVLAKDSPTPAPSQPAAAPKNVPTAKNGDKEPVAVAVAPPKSAAPPETKPVTPPQPPASPDPDAYRDPNAWRPFAAMVITGLSLPLAFWTRTVVPTMVGKALASLPAPRLRPRSLPSKSDV